MITSNGTPDRTETSLSARRPGRGSIRLLATLACAVAAAGAKVHAAAAAEARPRLLGLAEVSFYFHDLSQSRQFYERVLGFDEAHTAYNPDGSLRHTWFKVNDRQFIELSPEKAPHTDRLASFALQTDDAEGMRRYLKARGWTVPEHVSMGQTGAPFFDVRDPDGHTVEFLQITPDCWMAKDRGRHLSPRRISERITHCGIMVRNLNASLAFYRDILGCTEFWRGSKTNKVLSWANLRLPDGPDYLEFMLYDTMPPLARINTLHHFCLQVPDVVKARQVVLAREIPGASVAPTRPAIGVNGKRQVNTYDPDGTRVEIMEPNTWNGKPVPPSTAPPPA